jgi:hypothetical protein
VSTIPIDIAGDGARRRLTTEVLELGETLFDAVIEAATNRPTSGDSSGEEFPIGDIRAAADEFFHALRVLLDIDREAV